MNYRVLLYYKFVHIANPDEERIAHEQFCKDNNLKGRILLATEGINGTVSGLEKDTEAYKTYLQSHPLFAGMEFKEDPCETHSFNKLHIRVKHEIIRFDDKVVDPAVKTGKYIEPHAFKEILEKSDEDDDIVILDTRSDYEFNVGKFKNAVTLDIGNFRDLPDKLPEIEAFKGKKIYTYCTGGIRCEKVTAWMMDNGFEDVYQLHGGIINYGKETGGKDFEGTCYVFDQRVVVPVNEVNPTVIGNCEVCDAHTEKIINCANAACNKHFLICEGCATRLDGCCSQKCMDSPQKRDYDGKGYYLKGVNSKNYQS